MHPHGDVEFPIIFAIFNHFFYPPNLATPTQRMYGQNRVHVWSRSDFNFSKISTHLTPINSNLGKGQTRDFEEKMRLAQKYPINEKAIIFTKL